MKKKLENKHVIIGLVIFLSIVFSISLFRKINLDKTKKYTTAKIYSFDYIGRGMRTLDEEVAFYEYFVNNERYFSHTAIYPETKVGLCFEIKYSEGNPKNHEIVEKRNYFDCEKK
jgi:hypothetical protein